MVGGHVVAIAVTVVVTVVVAVVATVVVAVVATANSCSSNCCSICSCNCCICSSNCSICSSNCSSICSSNCCSIYSSNLKVTVVATIVVAVVKTISSSSSSRTDRYVYFQQNAGLILFVYPWIVHDSDCYEFTRTFGRFSGQCLSKLFFKELSVLMLTTSLLRAFQVVVILIGQKCSVTDVLKCFTISFAPLFLVLSLRL